MITWFYRIGVLLGCPLLVYSQISHNKKGVWIGLAAGAALIGVEALLEGLNLLTMIAGGLGAAAGIFAARLLDYTVYQMGNESWPEHWAAYAPLRQFALGALGMILAIRKLPEVDALDKDILAMGRRRGAELKVVDTSSIIDGRIVDICETHFLSGTLVIPRFVRDELKHLADAPDSLKKARGRRGLDVLAQLQANEEIKVRILDRDIPDLGEVDAKVVRLARELGAKVLTTDFNLNKIAALDGVPVLNVNDLANALKPVVLPGETMSLFVMKEGKEREQGVGYLDDGTMVVVEDGKRQIGKRIEVSVTSILQTSAGRMIFGRAKGAAAA